METSKTITLKKKTIQQPSRAEPREPNAIAHIRRVTLTPSQLDGHFTLSCLSKHRPAKTALAPSGTRSYPQVWPDTGGQVACGAVRGYGGRIRQWCEVAA